MMAPRLLLLTYSFPPANIIGAARPYQIARFFQNKGWDVQVISIVDESIADTDGADLSGLSSVRFEAPKIISWLNTVKNYSGRFGKLKTFLLRSLKFAIRSSVFPEHFIALQGVFVTQAMRLAKDKQFDLVISSALPFSVHCAARNVAKDLGLPWVADNRDLWAASPYRRTLPIWRLFDRRYERAVLAQASLVLGISESMVAYYRDDYHFDHALLVMNGYSLQAQAEINRENPIGDGLDIVYGGILYNGVRDPSPLLEAINSDPDLKAKACVRFFGSEPARVSMLADTFRDCAIENHPRVSKGEISTIYREASLLLVILGGGEFENGVMTGKFFEYLAHGKPVLAIASEESELAQVINRYGLGLATRSPQRIALFLRAFLADEVPKTIELPKELSIDHQLSVLYQAIESLPAFSSRPLAA